MSSPEIVIRQLEEILRHVRAIQTSLQTLDIPVNAGPLSQFTNVILEKLKDAVFQQHLEQRKIPADAGLDAVGTEKPPQHPRENEEY